MLTLYLQSQAQTQNRVSDYYYPHRNVFTAVDISPTSSSGCGSMGTAGGGSNNNNNNNFNGDSTSAEAHIIKHIDRTILACEICRRRFRDPKVLPCLHTFCLSCLCHYIPPQSLALSCPLCLQQSILPKIGPKGLQSNYFMTNLIDLLQDPIQQQQQQTDSYWNEESYNNSYNSLGEDYSFVVDCEGTEITVSSSGFESLNSSSSTAEANNSGNGIIYCSRHSGQELRYYCSDCESAICENCFEHSDHDVLSMSEAVEEEKGRLRSLVDEAQVRVPELKEAIGNVNRASGALSRRRDEIALDVESAFNAIIEKCKERKKAVIKELDSKEAQKQAILGRQKDELESVLADIYTACEFVDKALEAESRETDILVVKKQLEDRLEAFKAIKVDKDPAESHYINYIPGPVYDQVLEGVDKCGQVNSSSAVADKTTAVGEGLKRCFVSRTASVTVAARDCSARLVDGPDVEQFFCEIVPLALKSATKKAIELTTELTDMEDGTYELTYSVPVEGTYELAVKLFGKHISASPFVIEAIKAPPPPNSASAHSLSRYPTARKQQRSKSHFHGQRPPPISTLMHPAGAARSANESVCSRLNPAEDDLLFKVGSRGRDKGQFTNPQGVTVSPNGRVLVTDSNNQCVTCFGTGGEFRFKFGSRGRTPGQMQRPTGACFLLNGNIAIADYDNKCVSVFDPLGKFVNRIGHGKLQGPKGVTLNPSGHLIVVDNKASSVFVFQPNGKLLFKFGKRGSGEDQLAGPHYAAVTSRGHIVVSDFHNHSIKVFDDEGDYLFSFGSNGEGNGQFNAPTGVAVDKQDNIIVADWGNSRVQVFDSQGSFLTFVNTLTCPLYGPQGVSITHDGNIVVADSGNHCLKFYRYLQ